MYAFQNLKIIDTIVPWMCWLQSVPNKGLDEFLLFQTTIFWQNAGQGRYLCRSTSENSFFWGGEGQEKIETKRWKSRRCQHDHWDYFYLLPSLKLTYPLKMDGWNTSFLFKWPIFRGYVSFREGRYIQMSSFWIKNIQRVDGGLNSLLTHQGSTEFSVFQGSDLFIFFSICEASGVVASRHTLKDTITRSKMLQVWDISIFIDIFLDNPSFWDVIVDNLTFHWRLVSWRLHRGKSIAQPQPNEIPLNDSPT